MNGMGALFAISVRQKWRIVSLRTRPMRASEGLPRYSQINVSWFCESDPGKMGRRPTSSVREGDRRMGR